MQWQLLQTEDQLKQLDLMSASRDQVIFKHSTRCSISIMAKNRLDSSSAPESVDFFYLDLLEYRALSNLIAERYNVYHESPQVLIIRDAACIYDESHNAITMSDIVEQAEKRLV